MHIGKRSLLVEREKSGDATVKFVLGAC